MSLVYGVDGTRNGWVVSSYSMKEGEFSVFFINGLSELKVKPSDITLIDIPLALPSKNNTNRVCDALARKLLKKRACTLFSPPLIEAINKKTYQEALSTNIEYAGAGISKQAFNLKAKILEARKFALSNKNIYESHPELCFLALNGGKPLLVSKHSEEGVRQRLKLINGYDQKLKNQYRRAKKELSKLKVSNDDIVDSLVLCISALICKTNNKNMVSLPNVSEHDKTGLPIKIVYGSVS